MTGPVGGRNTQNCVFNRRVEFVLSSDALKFYNADLDFVAEPGELEVFPGE